VGAYVISKLSLRWNRFPGEIARLPYGEKAFMFASLLAENEELRMEVDTIHGGKLGNIGSQPKSMQMRRRGR